MVSSDQLKGVDNLATNKNITMRQFNGVDYDTLYPKTIASQVDGVYNKTEILTAATAALYGLGANAVPDDVLALLKTLVDNAQLSADEKAKIQTGSYIGTGTYGASNPCSITFDSTPKILWLYGVKDSLGPYSLNNAKKPIINLNDIPNVVTKRYGLCNKDNPEFAFGRLINNTYSWYSIYDGSSSSEIKAGEQFNRKDEVYYWMAWL